MSDTIREKIIKDIIAQLGKVKTASGYNTDCGLNVFRAVKAIERGDYPAFIVFPQTEAAERLSGKIVCTMPVRIEGIAIFGTSNPSTVSELILGDLIKVMCDPADRIAYADGVEYESGGTDDYPDSGEKSTGTAAIFNIRYKFKTGDPYTQ